MTLLIVVSRKEVTGLLLGQSRRACNVVSVIRTDVIGGAGGVGYLQPK